MRKTDYAADVIVAVHAVTVVEFNVFDSGIHRFADNAADVISAVYAALIRQVAHGNGYCAFALDRQVLDSRAVGITEKTDII